MSVSELTASVVALIFINGILILGLYLVWKRRTRAVQRAYLIAEERSNELRILKDLAETLNQTLPPDKALEAGLEQAARQVGATSGWILTLTPDHKADLSAGFNLPPNMELARSGSRPWALCNCLKEMINSQLNTPTPFECERLARTPGVAKDQKHHMSIPVRASGVPVGIFNLVFTTGRDFSENEIRLLSALGDQFGGAIERVRLFKEVHKLAITDPLTGLFNRRHFYVMVLKEMERSRRYQRPISLAMLDIDHFKQINDTFGHLAGDQVLQEVSRLCQETIRKIDLLGRFGGEEIMILMPETNAESAQLAMERLRQQVEQLEIMTLRGPARITISIGIASLTKDETMELNHFIDRVDQALYLAKNNGRNQVSML